MIIAILITMLLVLPLLVRKMSGAFNPVVGVFFYFYGLLLFSQFSVTGVPAPSNKTSFYFLLAFTFAASGALLAKRKRVSVEFNYKRKVNVYLCVLALFGVVPLLMVLYKNAGFILAYGYEAYVSAFRFSGDSIDIAGSKFLASVIERVSRPLAISASIVGTALFLTGRGKSLLYMGAFFLIVFSFLYVKRIDMMYVFVIFCAGVLAKRRAGGAGALKLAKGLFLLSFFVLLVLFVSSFRATSYNIHMLILHYGVGYHTYGFALFDYAINNPESHIHDVVFPGRTMFSTFEFVVSQFYKAIGVEFYSEATALYEKEIGHYVFMGFNTFNGDEIAPNGFYTSLYPIYRDLKVVGLFVAPFIYGFLFSKHYLTHREFGDARSLVWVIFFSWLGYASLLTPILMSNTFWLIPLMIYMLFTVRLRLNL